MKFGDYVFSWTKIPALEDYKIINQTSIRNKFPRTCESHMSDTSYKMYSVAEFEKVIKLHRFKDLEYIPQDRDCDDYSFSLMGHIRKLMPRASFGIMWCEVFDYKGNLLYLHAANCFVDKEYDLYFVEPQTNEIRKYNNLWKPYLIVM